MDHDDEIGDQDIENLLPLASTNGNFDPIKDTDYELIDEYNRQNHFSLDYMKRVVDCYDEISPVRDKRKRKWRTIKHLFQRVPNPQLIAHFRTYVEAGGTKKQKLSDVSAYAFDQFEHARHQHLSVHNIDSRRWGLKKARESSLDDF